MFHQNSYHSKHSLFFAQKYSKYHVYYLSKIIQSLMYEESIQQPNSDDICLGVNIFLTVSSPLKKKNQPFNMPKRKRNKEEKEESKAESKDEEDFNILDDATVGTFQIPDDFQPIDFQTSSSKTSTSSSTKSRYKKDSRKNYKCKFCKEIKKNHRCKEVKYVREGDEHGNDNNPQKEDKFVQTEKGLISCDGQKVLLCNPTKDTIKDNENESDKRDKQGEKDKEEE